MADSKKPTYSEAHVRSISERVYRMELARGDGGNDPARKAGAADRLIAKLNADGKDGPKMFSNFAGQYDHLTRAYLEVLGIEPGGL